VTRRSDLVFCVNKVVSISLTKDGEDKDGYTKTTYSNCVKCGESHPSPNPEIVDHKLTPPTFSWALSGCEADKTTGHTETATFTPSKPSASKNSSSVTFSVESPPKCDYEEPCPVECEISPDTATFTVVGVKWVKNVEGTYPELKSEKREPGKEEKLFIVNKGFDNSPEPQLLTTKLKAELDPDDVKSPPTGMTWSGNGVTSSSALTTDWKSDKFGPHEARYGCGEETDYSSKALLIVVEGGNIKSALADSDEVDDKYLQLFLNEDFTKEEDASDEEGHADCLKPDDQVEKPDPKTDELAVFSIEWKKDDDDDELKASLDGYSAYARIWVGPSASSLSLYDGTLKSVKDFWEKNTAMAIEGIKAGAFTLTLKMQSKHEKEPKTADELPCKVFPLDITADTPAPSSDEHEICDKSLMIMVNDNDSDKDGKIDLEDDKIENTDEGIAEDPDFAKLILNKPDEIKSDDAPDGIKITFSSALKLYKKPNKDEPIENGDSISIDELSNTGLELYAEGVKASADILDAYIKVEMKLKSGVVCRDEIKYTVADIRMAMDGDRDKKIEFKKPKDMETCSLSDA